jgi:DNA-3-methyladenine glycosylase I
MIVRCSWVGNDPLSIAYHDEEWGLPVHDDRELFEFIILEGAQAGLSWMTILKKRANYRQAFDHFEPSLIANYDEDKLAMLMEDSGIVRNRRKIAAAVQNANAFLVVQEQFGSFDKYIWEFVNGQPVKNAWRDISEIPSQTETSQVMSSDLRQRGFNFVGPTICYAFMQAVGMVNDHTVDCFRYDQV